MAWGVGEIEYFQKSRLDFFYFLSPPEIKAKKSKRNTKKKIINGGAEFKICDRPENFLKYFLKNTEYHVH